MPQMMPINWIILMFFFILIFILFNIMNYYIFNFNFKNKINNFNNKINNFNNKINYNWKW